MYLSKYLYENCTSIKFMHSNEYMCECAARTQKRDSPRARASQSTTPASTPSAEHTDARTHTRISARILSHARAHE